MATAIYDTSKCEDDMFFSSQSDDLSHSKTVPPSPVGIVRCALNFKTTNYYFYSYYLLF